MNKIKRNDEVVVLCGRDKGKRGVIKNIILDFSGKPEMVLVEGLNLVTHYERPDPQKNKPGGITRREAPLHASNVAVYNATTGKPARVKIKTNEKGEKTRIFVGGEESLS